MSSDLGWVFVVDVTKWLKRRTSTNTVCIFLLSRFLLRILPWSRTMLPERYALPLLLPCGNESYENNIESCVCIRRWSLKNIFSTNFIEFTIKAENAFDVDTFEIVGWLKNRCRYTPFLIWNYLRWIFVVDVTRG